MYENYFSRANRGLIVFLIDQSRSMSAIWSNGLSMADNVANSINLILNHIVLSWTWSDGCVRDKATITVIGYGGKDNYNAETLFCDSIDKINDAYPRTPAVIATKEGTVTINVFQAVKSTAGYGTPMASAFNLAKDVVAAWIQTHSGINDPVPVVINISDGMPTDSEADVRKYAHEILNMSIPDGTPLLFNVHISAENPSGKEVTFPIDGQTMSDSMCQLLYDISSKATYDFIKHIPASWLNIQPDCKLFMSNVQRVEKLLDLLYDLCINDERATGLK